MSTLTVAVALLSVNTLEMKDVNIYTKKIVSTLTVAVAALSANMLKWCFLGVDQIPQCRH